MFLFNQVRVVVIVKFGNTGINKERANNIDCIRLWRERWSIICIVADCSSAFLLVSINDKSAPLGRAQPPILTERSRLIHRDRYFTRLQLYAFLQKYCRKYPSLLSISNDKDWQEFSSISIQFTGALFNDCINLLLPSRDLIYIDAFLTLTICFR